jgi:hypothetical protein
VNPQVAETFKKLYFGKRTGVLTCEATEGRRAVYFSSGFLVGVRSSLEKERLGEVMIRQGRINRTQFEDASHFIKSGWKLGEILAELKIIAPEEIENYIRIQVLEIACSQLIAPPKRLLFSSLEAVDSSVGAPVSIADIFMEAARRADCLEKEIQALLQDNRKLGFPEDPLKRFQDVSLKPEEGFVLSRVDGTQTAKDILAISPLPEEVTARTLIGLMAAELVVHEGQAPVPEKPPSANQGPETARAETSAPSGLEQEREEVERLFLEFPSRNHWQVLELPEGASRDDIREAFMQRAKRFHPDRFRRIPAPDFQEKLSYVFRRISEANEILTSSARSGYEALAAKERLYDASRSASVPSRGEGGGRRGDPAAAVALYRRAQQTYEASDYWNTIQLCHEAIDVAPERAELYHLLGLALAKNPKWRQDAEKNLRIATNLDPWKADYFVALGSLYQEVGLHLRARKAFEQAKVVDPAAKVPEE